MFAGILLSIVDHQTLFSLAGWIMAAAGLVIALAVGVNTFRKRKLHIA